MFGSDETVGDFNDIPKPPMTDEEYFAKRAIYFSDVWDILKVYSEGKTMPFLDNVVYIGNFFQHIYDNLDIVKDPRFAINANFEDDTCKKAVIEKITMWNNEIPKELVNFMLTEDNIVYSFLQGSIQIADKLVKRIVDSGAF